MSANDLRLAYERDGFVVVRSFLPPAALVELRGQLDRYIRDVVPHLPDADAFYVDRSRPETLKQLQHMEHDDYFAATLTDERWLGLARALIGTEVHQPSVEWFNKPSGTNSPTPPHQDNYYFCLKPPDVVTIWVALDPVDDENGCLRYVPGSHRRGVRPHGRSHVLGFSQGLTDYGPADVAAERPIHLSPGDAVAHHGETIHRAEPNRSATRHRRSFAMVVRGVRARRDEEAFARYQAALKHQHEQLGLKT
jgi:phytanoyl-CoA hydroxylase